MRNIVLILLLLLTILPDATARTYFVSTSGIDDNSGDFSRPWKTWQKAFDSAKAGDTVYFRGGIYYATSNVIYNPPYNGNNGTPAKYICFFAYPADRSNGNNPVLDCKNKTIQGDGILVQRTEYIHFKGLTVRNNKQKMKNDMYASGFAFQNGIGLIIENCVSYNNGTRGFHLAEITSAIVLNCDSYNNIDSLTTETFPGNHGNGLMITGHTTGQPFDGNVTIIGCRSWGNSDSGFNSNYGGFERWENCWSWDNGRLRGEGEGFKYTPAAWLGAGVLSRKIHNCIAAVNKTIGFDENSNEFDYCNNEVDNNTSYGNGGEGFVTYPMGFNATRTSRLIRNNISYGNSAPFNWYWDNHPTDLNNSWNNPPGVTLSDEDFVSLDVSQLARPRKSDGSLPDIDFLKLNKGSDLIDAGIEIGFPSKGPPDLGAFEYWGDDINRHLVTSIQIAGEGGSTAITIQKGTLQLSATVIPADATIKTVIWSILNDSDLATIDSSTGLVKAKNNGIVIVKASATDGSGVFGTFTISISNQESSITVYPNPSRDLININLVNSSIIPDFLEIIDIHGFVCQKTELNFQSGSFIIPTNLKNGLYILKLLYKKSTLFSSKLIVLR